VDIRPDNIARAKLGAKTNSLTTASFEVNNALNLRSAIHGSYGVILRCGLFYHPTA
jgi:tRNA/tmRNA/rRNA uracil-C5-methylase (TrmA/RlmC/RlmD family)